MLGPRHDSEGGQEVDRRRKGSSRDSEDSEAHQDDSEPTESSDSDSGSEELEMPGRGEESQFIRMVADDSTDEVFFEEEPFEVAISTLAVQQIMPAGAREGGGQALQDNELADYTEGGDLQERV